MPSDSSPQRLRSGRLPGRIEGVKALSFSGFEQRRRGRNEDDLSAVEHIAGDHGGGELKRLRPAKRGSIEELTRRLKDGRIERLLNHAGSFNAEGLECGRGVFRGDFPGAFAAADGGVDLERRGSRNELAIVFNGLHEADECIGSLPSHKKPSEGRGLEEIAGHTLPRSTWILSSWIASAMESPWIWTGWNRCASSGMPASARLRRMVVVGYAGVLGLAILLVTTTPR